MHVQVSLHQLGVQIQQCLQEALRSENQVPFLVERRRRVGVPHEKDQGRLLGDRQLAWHKGTKAARSKCNWLESWDFQSRGCFQARSLGAYCSEVRTRLFLAKFKTAWWSVWETGVLLKRCRSKVKNQRGHQILDRLKIWQRKWKRHCQMGSMQRSHWYDLASAQLWPQVHCIFQHYQPNQKNLQIYSQPIAKNGRKVPKQSQTKKASRWTKPAQVERENRQCWGWRR